MIIRYRYKEKKREKERASIIDKLRMDQGFSLSIQGTLYRVIKIIQLTFITVHSRRGRTTINGRYLDYYRSEYESDTLIIVSTPDADPSLSRRVTDQGVALSFERRYLADVYESGFVKRAWVLDPNRQALRVAHESTTNCADRLHIRMAGCLFHLPSFSRTSETFSMR